MFPRNWGTKEFVDPFGSSSHGGAPKPPLSGALRFRNVDYPTLVPPPHVSHDKWKQTKGPIWNKLQGRNCATIADPHRRFYRQLIRAYNDKYAMGITTGEVSSPVIVLNSVVINVINTQGGPELKDQLLTFLQRDLKDDKYNIELQHLYDMIRVSIPENFWMIMYHPILMCIAERYHFPSDTRLGLEHHPDWESYFDDFVVANFPHGTGSIKVMKNIMSHHVFYEVFKNNNNKIEAKKGFVDNPAGLSRFARVLHIHGSDNNRNLQAEVVEQELTNRFPYMLVHLFQFLFEFMMTEIDRAFLHKRRPAIEDGLHC